MSPGQARALMREAARALEVADRLLRKYGEDGEDGSVIRFDKTFLVANSNRPASPAEIINSTFHPLIHKAYHFAAIRADGLWYTTGSSLGPQGVEWEDLLDWLSADEGAQGLAVESVEWLSRGFAKALNGPKDAPADATPGSHESGQSAGNAESGESPEPDYGGQDGAADLGVL